MHARMHDNSSSSLACTNEKTKTEVRLHAPARGVFVDPCPRVVPGVPSKRENKKAQVDSCSKELATAVPD